MDKATQTFAGGIGGTAGQLDQVLLIVESRAISSMLAATIDDLEGYHCRAAAGSAQADALLQADADRFFVAVIDLDCLGVVQDPAEAPRCLEAIRAGIDAIALRSGERSVPVSASIGATCEPGDHLDQMLLRADRAVYSAKRAGRNRVELR